MPSSQFTKTYVSEFSRQQSFKPSDGQGSEIAQQMQDLMNGKSKSMLDDRILEYINCNMESVPPNYSPQQVKENLQNMSETSFFNQVHNQTTIKLINTEKDKALGKTQLYTNSHKTDSYSNKEEKLNKNSQKETKKEMKKSKTKSSPIKQKKVVKKVNKEENIQEVFSPPPKSINQNLQFIQKEQIVIDTITDLQPFQENIEVKAQQLQLPYSQNQTQQHQQVVEDNSQNLLQLEKKGTFTSAVQVVKFTKMLTAKSKQSKNQAEANNIDEKGLKQNE
eukprot:403373036